jgi:dTDP-4-amino-4,6-dideoxygalactose transaminase
LQAVIGNWLIGQVHEITDKRIANAARLDRGFAGVKQIRIPPRAAGRKLVYHLYIVFAEDRDGLLRHCMEKGVEVKVHYPLPVYRQPGLAHFGYGKGDFPVTDRHAETMISLPAHDHLSADQIDYVIETVRGYYGA